MLSIIIVSYNTSDLTLNCIRSIYQETIKSEFEIIVVDNHSKDNTIVRIKSEFPKVIVIENERNVGLAAAINLGIRKAQGEVILSLNSDTIIMENAIDKSYKYIKENQDIFILGCKLLNIDGSLQFSVGNLPCLANCFYEAFFLNKVFPNSRVFEGYFLSNFNYDKIVEVEWIKGAFMMIKKSVFDSIGYFDENYFLYTEETDFFFRANKANLKIVFFPDCKIYHIDGASSSSQFEKLHRKVHKTRLYFFKKYFRGVELKLLQIIQYFAMINRVIVYFLGGVVLFRLNLIKKSYYFLKAIF